MTRTLLALLVWLVAVAYALQTNTATGFVLYLAGWAVLLFRATSRNLNGK